MTIRRCQWSGRDSSSSQTRRFGRSDYRRRLRSFFEVDRYHVVVAALNALAEEQRLPAKKVTEAIVKYGIDPEGPNPARS